MADILKKSNVGHPGVFVYRVDGDNIEQHCVGEWLSECLSYLNKTQIPEETHTHRSLQLRHMIHQTLTNSEFASLRHTGTHSSTLRNLFRSFKKHGNAD